VPAAELIDVPVPQGKLLQLQQAELRLDKI